MSLRNIKDRSRHIRSSPEMKQIINIIRAKYIMAGKIPPTTSKITKIIAKKIKVEDILEDELIRM